MTARERYLAMLTSWPHWTMPGDAIVLLSGDGETRVEMACRLMATAAEQTLVVTGGYDDPPYSLTADKLAAKAMGLGVAPGKILRDGRAMNTREQAVNTVARAKEHGWKVLVLVASPDHIARAHLTFIRALDDEGLADTVLVLPVLTRAKWTESPAGRELTRLEMLDVELRKVDAYASDVATWERGVEYLTTWEAKL